MKKTRIAALLLALVLCLTLLPMAAMAEEGAGGVSYTITFDASPGKFSDGNTTVELKTKNAGGQNLVDGQPGSLPVWEGHVFDCWYVNFPGENPGVFNINFTADATVKANWQNPEIYLDPNGGDLPAGANKILPLDASGAAYILKEELPTPTREDYTFAGWYWKDSGRNDVVKTGDALVPGAWLTAEWTKAAAPEAAASFRIDFIPNGGKITSIRGIPAKDILAGSMKAQENNVFVDQNSGIGMMMTGGDGRLDSFPEIEREGYTFDGWYTAKTGGSKVTADTVFTGSGKYGRDYLWARWKAEKTTVTVKFNLNYKNPRDEAPDSITVTKGNPVSLPDGKKLTCPFLAHEFYAWCIKGEDGLLYPWKESTPVTTDMTLYAGWIRKSQVIKNGEALPDTSSQPAETPAPAETSKTAFTDVAESSPFAPAISWAVEKKITNGKTASTFGPGDPCTRAQIVTFLWRAAGSPEPKSMEAEYADVTNKDAYYYKAIQWAAEMDMEYSGTFSPGDTCTRATAVYFIWKASGSPKAGTKASFTDLPEEPEDGSQWYWPDLLDAVDWAVGQGVTNGTGDGTTFSPDNPCTRGQIVTFLYRAYET